MSEDRKARPWKYWRAGYMPSSDTLRAWRVAADKLAKAIGAPFACNLCKRPIKTAERFGRLTMRPPKAWRGRLFERKICHSCYIAMKSLIEELEMLGARDHLPPEDYTDDLQTTSEIQSNFSAQSGLQDVSSDLGTKEQAE